MRYLDEKPILFDDADDMDAASVVTLIRTVHRAPSDGPGAFERGMSKLWSWTKRTLITCAAVAAVGAYPAMMITAHQIDDSVPALDDPNTPWMSASTGMASTLVAREIDGRGWVADYPDWRPEARLNALPAWQASLSDSLSAYIRVRAEHTIWQGEPDSDLMTAARLLTVRDDGKTEARLYAAREALARYDGRLRADLAVQPIGLEAVQAQVALVSGFATDSRSAVGPLISEPDRFFGRQETIGALYSVRGQAQVASIALAGLLMEEGALPDGEGVREAAGVALDAWRRIAEMSPLFVANSKPGSFFPGNDLIEVAYLLDEAGRATLALDAALTSAAMVTPAQATDADDPAAGNGAQAASANAVTVSYLGPSLKPAR